MSTFVRAVASAAVVWTAAAGDSAAADMSLRTGSGREAVLACDIAGFIVLPGTDVCLAVGGHARLDATFIDQNWLGSNGFDVSSIAVDGYSVAPSGVMPTISYAIQDAGTQLYGAGRLTFDARTRTEFGTVRAYVEGQAEDDGDRTGGDLSLRHAYVQVGNWLFGKTWSTFLFREYEPDYAEPYKVVGDNSGSMRRNQIRYTREFGAGVALLLALEDQNYNEPPAAIVGLGPNVPIVNPAASAYSVATDGENMPDVVAALRWVREGVGAAQIAGALHQNRYAETQTFGNLEIAGHADDDLGFAVLFGLALETPTGDGDAVTFTANYTDGASQYLQDVYGSSTEIAWGRCGVVNCILDQVRIWSVFSSFTHHWSERWKSTAGAGYAETDYGAVGTALAGPAGVPGVLDVATYEVFANVSWKPVERTTFMLDVHYGHIDYGSFDVNPTLAGLQSDQGAWSATLEVTRRF